MRDLRVVRPFGTERTHVADVASHQLDRAVAFGSEFTTVLRNGVLRGVCGITVRGDLPVVMNEGTKIVCPSCKALTGYTEAAAGNPRQESGWGWGGPGPDAAAIDVHSFAGGGAIAVAVEPIETGRKKTLRELLPADARDQLPELERQLRAWDNNAGRESARAVTERGNAIVDAVRRLLTALEETP